MKARLASKVLLALGVADLAFLNLVLAPRLTVERALSFQHAANPSSFRMALGSTESRPDRWENSDVAAPRVAGSSAGPTAGGSATADLEFEFGTARITTPDARNELQRIALQLRNDPTRRLLLRGHADRLGTPRSNLEVGKKRAETVLRFLIASGAPADRISIESVGDREPADPTDTPLGWAHNRRVQLLWR